jgi:hypothetical protein
MPTGTLTLAELQTQLTTVNTAISNLIAGKQILELVVGNGSFSRRYRYGEVTLVALKQHRDEILQQIQSIELSTPVYRHGASVPLVVGKLGS